jgi:phosphoribosylformylglycinamidine synthase
MRLAGARVETVHLNRLLSGQARIDDFAMLVIPGGFSYGDHLGAGAMLAAVLRDRLMDDLTRFVGSGRPVLGICNGFQVLARMGLLGPMALIENDSGRFECRWVRLTAEPSTCIFLRDLDRLELPIAHGVGRLVIPDGGLAEGRLSAPLRYVENPNGSTANVAGVCNEAGNVFGLMPHPERYVTALQHPTRSPAQPAGLSIFRNAVAYARDEL